MGDSSTKDLSRTRVLDMKLGVRAINALLNGLCPKDFTDLREAYERITAADVAARSERDLLRFKGFGHMSLTDTKEALAGLGLSLRADGNARPIVPTSVERRIAKAIAAEREACATLIDAFAAGGGSKEARRVLATGAAMIRARS